MHSLWATLHMLAGVNIKMNSRGWTRQYPTYHNWKSSCFHCSQIFCSCYTSSHNIYTFNLPVMTVCHGSRCSRLIDILINNTYICVWSTNVVPSFFYPVGKSAYSQLDSFHVSGSNYFVGISIVSFVFFCSATFISLLT